MNKKLKLILGCAVAGAIVFITALSCYLSNKSYNNQLDLSTTIRWCNRLNKEIELLRFQIKNITTTFPSPNGEDGSALNFSKAQEYNILGPINDFIEAYQRELSTMSSEQLACLTNAIGFIVILSVFTSIVIILFGDYLISKLQLETRYPRLAKFIQIRQKVNKYFLVYNIVFTYFMLISYICINIFMFFQVK